jgi:hypothetical protein
MQEGVRRAYHDRNGAPITTAPRLAVPESVPNRTLPDSQVAAFAPRLPTTGQPVETARNATTVPGGLSRTQVTAVLLGGVATFAIMVGAVVWFVWGATTTSRSAPGDVQVVAYPTAAPTPAPSASSTSTAPAPTAAPDLPEAGAAQPTAKTVPIGRPPASTATTATAGVPAAKSSCTPPYTIDKAGHRIPKPECD